MKSSSSGRGAAITQLEEHHPSLLQSSSDITTDTVPTCLSDLIEHCGGVLSCPIVLEEDLEDIVRGDGFNAELLHDVSDEETAKDISRSKKLMRAISEVVSGAFMLVPAGQTGRTISVGDCCRVRSRE